MVLAGLSSCARVARSSTLISDLRASRSARDAVLEMVISENRLSWVRHPRGNLHARTRKNRNRETAIVTPIQRLKRGVSVCRMVHVVRLAHGRNAAVTGHRMATPRPNIDQRVVLRFEPQFGQRSARSTMRLDRLGIPDSAARLAREVSTSWRSIRSAMVGIEFPLGNGM